MNKNLLTLFNKIFNDRKVVLGFTSKKSMIELYKYCLSVIDGYTYEEFVEFMRELVMLFINDKKLSDNATDNVVGGTKFNSNYSKALSSLIATGAIFTASTLLTSNFSNNSRAKVDDLSKSYASTESELSEEFSKLKDVSKEDAENVFNTALNCLKTLPNAIIPSVSASSIEQNSYYNPNQKGVPEAYSWPTASITYGESLSQIKFEGGSFSIPGFISINDIYKDVKPSAGYYSCGVTFYPYDSQNYDTISTTINVKVNKAIPKTPDNFSSVYKSGLRLSDFSLPKGWNWKNPSLNINQAGDLAFEAHYSGNSNYLEKDEYIKIHIEPAEPKLYLKDITYNKNLRISDISLPMGWHWCWWGNDFDHAPKAGDNYYYVSYDANFAGTNVYKSVSNIRVCLRVKQAPAKVDVWPSASGRITYGKKLSDLPLVNGKSKIDGNFYWSNPNTVPVVKNSGYQVVFIPKDPNYCPVYQNINVFVDKNMAAPNSLNPSLNHSYARKIVLNRLAGYEYSMDSGKTWQDSCEFSGLDPDKEYKFVCRVKENENTCSGKISDVLSVSTKKLQTVSPRELTLEERTNHKIKFKKFEGQEYSKDDGKTWQDSSEFTDLSGSTTYKFTTRIKENTVYDASEKTPSISITTKSFFRNAWDNFKGIFSS